MKSFGLDILKQLKRMDPVLGNIIDLVDDQEIREPCGNDFKVLSTIIAGQQLSTLAAQPIWARTKNVGQFDEPTNYIGTSQQPLPQLGFSRQKDRFIRELANDLRVGAIDLSMLSVVDIDEARAALLSIRGIREWSTDMFLLSALQHLDVFSKKDAGVRRSICRLSEIPDSAYETLFDEIAAIWRPYRSVASIYLWSWLDNKSENFPDVLN
jgi:DNA-3-methyladenine glycosylase II